jgi:transposase
VGLTVRNVSRFRTAKIGDERTLADLPWAAYRVRLQLRVRKWFCGNRRCRRRIFTERLPTVAAPWARRTLRLT